MEWVKHLRNSHKDSSFLSQACWEPLSHKENYISPDWGHKMAAHVTLPLQLCVSRCLSATMALQWKCIQYKEKGMETQNKGHNLIHLKISCDTCCFSYFILLHRSSLIFLNIFSFFFYSIINIIQRGISEWCSVCCWWWNQGCPGGTSIWLTCCGMPNGFRRKWQLGAAAPPL